MLLFEEMRFKNRSERGWCRRTSDTIREFVSGTGALKRERSLSVVFGFERRKSENLSSGGERS